MEIEERKGDKTMKQEHATNMTMLVFLAFLLSMGSVAAQQERINNREAIKPGKGMSVNTHVVDRPFWKLHADDLNGDGTPELIGCDVDGLVTVRNPGSPAFFTHAPGALVYQFEAVDLNHDGTKEILISSVDPKFSIYAIDLEGNRIREFPGYSSHERIGAGDLDGDGYPEVVTTKNNHVAGSGIAGGIVLYDDKGRILWEKDGSLREFRIADIHPKPGKEIITGGPATNFRIYNKQGVLLKELSFSRGELDHFLVYDTDQDGANEIVFTNIGRSKVDVHCSDGNELIWKSTISITTTGEKSSLNVVAGDYDKSTPGIELVLAGSHDVSMLDGTGNLIYKKKTNVPDYYWGKWADPGINSLDIASWNDEEPHLFLSSSRFRHQAYYELTYSDQDELSTYHVPDLEKHLETIYQKLHKQPAQKPQGTEKLKVFVQMKSSPCFTEDQDALYRYRKVLDGLETDKLEYLVLGRLRDLNSGKGLKLTTNQIADRAKMLEKAGIPFGYFIGHGGHVSISEEALRKSKEAAPKMFRFLYVAENLKIVYKDRYKNMLATYDKLLDFAAENEMKMIFKEKHDVWGWLPADPEVRDILFSEDRRDVTVPVWSTNQAYQPEVQLGGLLGLKYAGLCKEFGMSTQSWNWHEWGRWPRGIRDVTPTYVCPSDIILRLDLMGMALGATWIHVEGMQTYLEEDVVSGLAPLAFRHRELAYELVKKNVLIPGATPVNWNTTAIVRPLHPEMVEAKKKLAEIGHPFYARNSIEGFRKGFIPARHIFETYSPDAFPWIAYDMRWNSHTCFPETPNGWIPFVPSEDVLPNDMNSITTDGDKILMNGQWTDSKRASNYVEKRIHEGASEIPFEASGTCMIVQKDELQDNTYKLVLIDPGYLAPMGVQTVIKSVFSVIESATDMVTGEAVEFSGNTCPVQIERGAFRVIKVELE